MASGGDDVPNGTTKRHYATGTTPKKSVFKSVEEELRYWQELARSYQKEARRASDSEFKEIMENKTLKHDLNELKTELTNLSATLDATRQTTRSDMRGTQSSSADDLMPLQTSDRTSTVMGSIPKLSNFDGKDSGSYPYRRYAFDVRQLQKAGYSESVVRMAVLRSCKGAAADILQTLGGNLQLQKC
jgi:hypothetical protein